MKLGQKGTNTLLKWNETFTFGAKIFKSEQNFMNPHNCNEIRNKIILKSVQNFNYLTLLYLLLEQNLPNQNKTLLAHTINCNKIRKRILLKLEQNFYFKNKSFLTRTKL